MEVGIDIRWHLSGSARVLGKDIASRPAIPSWGWRCWIELATMLLSRMRAGSAQPGSLENLIVFLE
jgi:hypothetical protein